MTPDELFHEYRPLAMRVANDLARFHNQQHQVEDIRQEASMALLAAARTWSGEGFFGGFAKKFITNKLANYVHLRHSLGRGVCWARDDSGYMDTNPVAGIEFEQTRKKLVAALAKKRGFTTSSAKRLVDFYVEYNLSSGQAEGREVYEKYGDSSANSATALRGQRRVVRDAMIEIMETP